MGWWIYRRAVPLTWRQVIGLTAALALIYVTPFRAWTLGVITDRIEDRQQHFVDRMNDTVDRMTSTTATAAP